MVNKMREGRQQMEVSCMPFSNPSSLQPYPTTPRNLAIDQRALRRHINSITGDYMAATVPPCQTMILGAKELWGEQRTMNSEGCSPSAHDPCHQKQEDGSEFKKVARQATFKQRLGVT